MGSIIVKRPHARSRRADSLHRRQVPVVVLLTGAFTGMVMCAQFYIQFHKVKMDSAVMSVVSVAMCRELGAVLTALMVSGRVGAAMARSSAR